MNGVRMIDLSSPEPSEVILRDDDGNTIYEDYLSPAVEAGLLPFIVEGILIIPHDGEIPKDPKEVTVYITLKELRLDTYLKTAVKFLKDDKREEVRRFREQIN